MKLVDVTNSYKQLVNQQLENTDAYFVKVYSAGNTTVIYTEASEHAEIVIINKKRALQKTEIDEILTYFLELLPKEACNREKISIISLKDVTEISLPLMKNYIEK